MEKEEYFKTVFDTHYQKVYRLCKGYFVGNEEIASDATQEVFIKVWENLDGFRNESSISTWIYKISVNTCLLYLRNSKKYQTTTIDNLSIKDSENEWDEKEDQLKKMYQCIDKLDEVGKMMTLMMLEGVDYDEIANVVGVSQDTLRVRIHRIKKSLTQCVQNERV